MKKLHKLVLGSYIGPFVVTFFVSIFILMMQFLWKWMESIIGKGLDFSVIAELLFYASTNLITMALPLAVLLSSIMTLGNLGEFFELTAIKATGNSLLKTIIPLIIFNVLLSIGAFFFSNNMWPVATLKFKSLLWDISQQKPTFKLKDGVFYNDIDGMSIRIDKKIPNTNKLEGILIYNHSNNSVNRNVVKAEKGEISTSEDGRYLEFKLQNGYSYQEIQDKPKDRITKPQLKEEFEEKIVRIDLSTMAFQKTNEDLFRNNYQMLNLNQLIAAKDTIISQVDKKKINARKYYLNSLSLTNTASSNEKRSSGTFIRHNFVSTKDKNINMALSLVKNTRNFLDNYQTEMEGQSNRIDRYEIEIHRKFTFATACLILFFIGSSLGAIIKKGGYGVPVVVSIALFIAYYMLSIAGEKMTIAGTLPPALGMWMATFVLLPIAIFVTFKANSDSRVIDVNFIQKISRVLKNFRS